MPNRQTHLATCAELLKSSRRCLLLGANGSGMLALADVLSDAGHEVLGMDSSVCLRDDPKRRPGPDQLPQSNDNNVAPWSVESIPTGIELCITTTAVAADDSVLRHVTTSGYPVLTLHECLSLMFAGRKQICVAGTHGKSTTSAMLAIILQHAERSPSFFVGATVPDLGRSGRHASGEWSVLESCEFRESFLNLQPEVAVLTGIERDHFDCFPSQQQEDEAFRKFAIRTAKDGTIVYPASCHRSVAVVHNTNCRRTSFAVEGDEASKQNADWLASDVRQLGRQTTFVCTGPNNTGPNNSELVRLQIPGLHNVRNAIAAIAAARSLGISIEVSAMALAEFSGIDRRFQMRGDYAGVTLIDDYAHHPTAIRETLATVRQSFPGQRLLVAFEPHQISRTQALFPEFVTALSAADEAWLLPVFPAREDATHLECCRLSGQLVKEVNLSGTKSFLFANLDQIASRIDHSGRRNDILLTMGAGRTNLIHDQLNRRLQRHSVA